MNYLRAGIDLKLNSNMSEINFPFVEFCALPRYYPAKGGNSVLTFQDSAGFPVSSAKKSKKTRTSWTY
jgi:hypothetical protein